MNRQEKLEWLARKLERWPQGAVSASTDGVEARFSVKYPIHEINPIDWFTKQEWLSTREKLQNKPSWSDAPEWAEWMAQSGVDGGWEVYAGKPTPRKKRKYWSHHGYIGSRIDKQGEILGNWCDTLEARPLVMKINKPKECVIINQTWKGAMKVTITTQDNSWHERGELPPVGTSCECVSSAPASECRIIAYSDEQVCVRWRDNKLLDVIDITSGAVKFRPLRTDREKAIDEMMSDCSLRAKDGAKQILGELYDAGYRKQ